MSLNDSTGPLHPIPRLGPTLESMGNTFRHSCTAGVSALRMLLVDLADDRLQRATRPGQAEYPINWCGRRSRCISFRRPRWCGYLAARPVGAPHLHDRPAFGEGQSPPGSASQSAVTRTASSSPMPSDPARPGRAPMPPSPIPRSRRLHRTTWGPTVAPMMVLSRVTVRSDAQASAYACGRTENQVTIRGAPITGRATGVAWSTCLASA